MYSNLGRVQQMVIWQKFICNWFQNIKYLFLVNFILSIFIQGIFFHVWLTHKRYNIVVVTCLLNDSSVSFLMNYLVKMNQILKSEGTVVKL